METENEKCVLFIKNVPKTLKAEFHAACARQRKSMTEVILEFMRGKVLETKKQDEN